MSRLDDSGGMMITDDRAVVGAILNGAKWMSEEPLSDPTLEAIARAAVACEPVTIEAVAQQLQREGQLEHVGGIAYLTELAGIPEANEREAFERGAADGRAAQAGKLVRVYPPEEPPGEVEDSYVDLEIAYWDGWNRGAYETVVSLLEGRDREVATAVLMQFAHVERPEADTIEDVAAIMDGM
jgi:hypothetical protein